MMHPNIDSLNEYIKKVRDVPFQWHVNDCFTFTNNAFHAMYGEGWADDWDGKYTKNGMYLKRDGLRKVFGAQTLEQGIDEKLQRYHGIPPRGALVSTDKTRRWVIGQALGISVGAKAIFLGETGVVSVYIEDIKNAWVKA